MTVAYLFLRFQGAPLIRSALTAIRPVVVVLIFMAAVTVGRQTILDFKSAGIAVLVLILMLRTKLNPILLLIGAGITGVIIF